MHRREKLVIRLYLHEKQEVERVAREKKLPASTLARQLLMHLANKNEKPATGLVYEAETVSGFTVSQPL